MSVKVELSSGGSVRFYPGRDNPTPPLLTTVGPEGDSITVAVTRDEIRNLSESILAWLDHTEKEKTPCP